MNAPASTIEQLLLELPDLDWITDEGRVTRLSQDFSWFSPVLTRQLKDKRSDVVVRPRTEDEIRAVVGACARRSVPITIRGSVCDQHQPISLSCQRSARLDSMAIATKSTMPVAVISSSAANMRGMLSWKPACRIW